MKKLTKQDKIVIIISIWIVIAVVIMLKLYPYYSGLQFEENKELATKKYNEEKEKQIKDVELLNERKTETCKKYKYLEHRKIKTGRDIDAVTNEIHSLGFENYGEPVDVPTSLSERNIRCTEFSYYKYENGFKILISATVYADNLVTIDVEALDK